MLLKWSKKYLPIRIASALLASFFLAILSEKLGNISIAFVLLASFEDPIRLKCFFHLTGLTKYTGKLRAEHMPLITPNEQLHKLTRTG